MQIPISIVETEPECVFEIGFQYTTWNGKDDILSEKTFLVKITFRIKEKLHFMQLTYKVSYL